MTRSARKLNIVERKRHPPSVQQPAAERTVAIQLPALAAFEGEMFFLAALASA
jgi:hypothetical protein